MEAAIPISAPQKVPGLHGSIIIRVYEDGFVVAVTSYPPLEGETWERGNDLADGYLQKEGTIEQVASAVRAVLEGDRS